MLTEIHAVAHSSLFALLSLFRWARGKSTCPFEPVWCLPGRPWPRARRSWPRRQAALAEARAALAGREAELAAAAEAAEGLRRELADARAALAASEDARDAAQVCIWVWGLGLGLC